MGNDQNQQDELRAAHEKPEQANQKLRETQAWLVQAQKMAGLGQIATGIAHEINNPVESIMSNLETLTEYVATFKNLIAEYEQLAGALKPDAGPEANEILKRVEEIHLKENLTFMLKDVDQLLSESIEGTGRVKEIVQSLKCFSRLDPPEKEKADINKGIEATLRLLGNELKYKCRVHKKLNPLPSIPCYAGQLNQVFMNILMNAAQAIPDQGEITIETRATDKEVVILISDTGTGISPEHLPKLFTPFFTTKSDGEGTGLGLSISYGIVRDHQGSISVESKVGEGTTFVIRLPIQQDAVD